MLDQRRRRVIGANEPSDREFMIDDLGREGNDSGWMQECGGVT